MTHRNRVLRQSVGVAAVLVCLALGIAAVTFGNQAIPAHQNWDLVWTDSGAENWSEDWLLFGSPDRISVTNSPGGMTLRAGDGTDAKADHAILWSRRSFAGDLRVEWDYTVLDRYSSVVPPGGYCSALLLYGHGIGSAEAPADLLAWSPQARQADTSGRTMSETTSGLQLNYAFVGDPRGNRVRLRVNPGYRLGAESAETDFFEVGVPYHVAIEKHQATLSITVTESRSSRVFSTRFDDPLLHQHSNGRIGFRNMNRRESVYANIRVYEAR